MFFFLLLERLQITPVVGLTFKHPFPNYILNISFFYFSLKFKPLSYSIITNFKEDFPRSVLLFKFYTQNIIQDFHLYLPNAQCIIIIKNLISKFIIECILPNKSLSTG